MRLVVRADLLTALAKQQTHPWLGRGVVERWETVTTSPPPRSGERDAPERQATTLRSPGASLPAARPRPWRGWISLAIFVFLAGALVVHALFN
jgi:hypothetical protein